MAARFPAERRTSTGGRWLPAAFVASLALLAAGLLWDFSLRKNFDTVVPGRIYRSGQPSEGELEKWIRQYGFKTILSLRHGIPPYERELAERYRVEIVHVPFSANDGIPEGQWEVLQSILTDEDRFPILIHCRGGGDRTGIVTALYRIEVQGWTLEEALREMNRHYYISLRYPALREELRERSERRERGGAYRPAP